MQASYFFLFRNTLLFFLVCTCLLSFLNFKKLPYSFKVLGVYAFVTLLLELLAIGLAKNGMHNLFVLHLFTLLELIFFALFFKPLLKVPTLLVKHYDKLIFVLVALIIANSLFIQPLTVLNSYSETVENIVLIVLSIMLFSNLYLKLDPEIAPYRKPIIWVNSGLLLYLSGSLFIFMFGEYMILGDYILQHSVTNQVIVWFINVILNLIFKIFMLVAIIQVIRKQNSLKKGAELSN